jgi:hypothetical protein
MIEELRMAHCHTSVSPAKKRLTIECFYRFPLWNHLTLEFEKLSEKLTLSHNPKKTRVFLPLKESISVEKPGASVDLTFFVRFITILGAVRWG